MDSAVLCRQLLRQMCQMGQYVHYRRRTTTLEQLLTAENRIFGSVLLGKQNMN